MTGVGSFAQVFFLSFLAALSRTAAVCDKNDIRNTLQLSDIPVWQKESGYWVGDLTFLGPDGEPFTSDAWPYRFDNYKGFIKIETNGSALKQRNIFVYPPLSRYECRARKRAGNITVQGNGKCGRNGNEKVFKADIEAVDCAGNLAGSFLFGSFTVDTFTTVIGDDTVLYRVQAGGQLIQNQLTTVFEGNRVRTAQNFAATAPTAASYYRETKVNEDTWNRELQEARRRFNIRVEDYCGFDAGNMPNEVSCSDWFAN